MASGNQLANAFKFNLAVACLVHPCPGPVSQPVWPVCIDTWTQVFVAMCQREGAEREG